MVNTKEHDTSNVRTHNCTAVYNMLDRDCTLQRERASVTHLQPPQGISIVSGLDPMCHVVSNHLHVHIMARVGWATHVATLISRDYDEDHVQKN